MELSVRLFQAHLKMGIHDNKKYYDALSTASPHNMPYHNELKTVIDSLETLLRYSTSAVPPEPHGQRWDKLCSNDQWELSKLINGYLETGKYTIQELHGFYNLRSYGTNLLTR